MDSATETNGIASVSGKRRFRAQGFQLDENPRALSAVILFLLLACYAFVDGLITPYEGYISTPPYWLFVLAGVACAAVGYFGMRRGAVPPRESAGVAALVGVAAAFALYPGFLRISNLLGDGKFDVHTYTMAADFTLHAQNESAPPFKGPLDGAYWRDHIAGDQWSIEVRQGVLGVWSYRIEPLRQEIDGYNARKAIIEGVKQGLAKPAK